MSAKDFYSEKYSELTLEAYKFIENDIPMNIERIEEIISELERIKKILKILIEEKKNSKSSEKGIRSYVDNKQGGVDEIEYLIINLEALINSPAPAAGGKRSAKGRKRMTTKGRKRSAKGRKRSSTKRSSTKRSSTKRATKKRM